MNIRTFRRSFLRDDKAGWAGPYKSPAESSEELAFLREIENRFQFQLKSYRTDAKMSNETLAEGIFAGACGRRVPIEGDEGGRF
jgi:hypothetical protein